MKSRLTTGLVLALITATPPAASAHHSFAAFDQTKVVSVKGTVKEFQWTNPHTWLQLVVVTQSGASEEWSLEGLSPNILGRMGWKRDSVAPGDVVTAFFNPMRSGAHGGNLVRIVRADGTQVPTAGEGR